MINYLVITRRNAFRFTWIVRFCSYVTRYQYDAKSRLTGKSKSWMYFLIILTDSNTYSLQSETRIYIVQACYICILTERAILTRRYFFLYAQCGNCKIQGDMVLMPTHSVFIERYDGIDFIHFYILQDVLCNRVCWPLYSLIVRQLAAPAHLSDYYTGDSYLYFIVSSSHI